MVSLMPLLLFLATKDGVPARNADAAAIERQSDRLDRAFETGRMSVWNDVLADDFHAFTPRGTYDKAAFIAGGTDEARSARQPVSVDVRHVRLDVRGGRATALSSERTCYGVRGAGRVEHRLCYRQRFTERWRKQGRVWRLADIRYGTGQSLRLDGRPVSRLELAKLLGR